MGNCSGTATSECVKEGESLGAVVPDNNKQCCAGLVPYIHQEAIGTRGICKKIPTPLEIFPIPPTPPEIYPSRPIPIDIPYAVGSLLKKKGENKIYMVQDEKLRYISSAKIFRAHGFKLKNVINVAPNVIDKYEMVEDLLPYPNGTLIKSAGRLYFIQDYELRYVASIKALKSLKFRTYAV
ncbi:hypothetical protein HY750_02595 [Candidatus Kuenenbacteria bacterium]|nr:hypothetical protein [Candidatus Kuenenbacteria bacterium]